MLLSMNHQFYPYQRDVIPFAQRAKGDISIYGGTHPYGQGGNGLGGMFLFSFEQQHLFSRPLQRKWENGYCPLD